MRESVRTTPRRKELVLEDGCMCRARLMHDESPRANGPFIAVNCGAITESVLKLNEGHRGETADQLEIGSATLYRKLKAYDEADR